MIKKSKFLVASILFSVFISPLAVSAVDCILGASCTVNGQAGTCTQGGQARDYLIYCSANAPATGATTGTAPVSSPTASPYPSTSISGDDLCGGVSSDPNNPAANECSLTHLKKLISGLLVLFTTVGSVLLVLFIVFRLVVSWWAFRMGNAGAIKKAVNDSWQATIGFFIIFALFGGLFVLILRTAGVQDFILRIFSDALIPHAYAATTATGPTMLPNPTSANNLYDILISFARLVIRWFVYPAIIFMWLITGFSYVYAQGKPDEIKKSHSYAMWAAIITIAVVMTQGFIFAFRNTAQQVIGSTPGAQQITAPATQYTPQPGQTGAVCTAPDGTYGQLGMDGSCTSRSSSYSQGLAPAACVLGASCTTNGQTGTCVQGGQARDYAIYCSANAPAGGCVLDASCTTSSGQPGTCVRGSSSQDYVPYCSANGTAPSGTTQRCYDVTTNTTRDGTPDANGGCTAPVSTSGATVGSPCTNGYGASGTAKVGADQSIYCETRGGISCASLGTGKDCKEPSTKSSSFPVSGKCQISAQGNPVCAL